MDDQLHKATPTGLFSSSRNSGDNIALAADQPTVTGSDVVPQPRWRSGFVPHRLTGLDARCMASSNAVYDKINWHDGGSFSEVGTTRHAAKVR